MVGGVIVVIMVVAKNNFINKLIVRAIILTTTPTHTTSPTTPLSNHPISCQAHSKKFLNTNNNIKTVLKVADQRESIVSYHQQKKTN